MTAPARRPRAIQPTTERSPDIEAARYRKAVKVAHLLEQEHGVDVDPSNESCRLAAKVLIAQGHLADTRFSDQSCEIVRVILTTRAVAGAAWAAESAGE